ncbi:expressed unknown protein [Seminavis robusta]|uniref:Uncharacterized protein n=1 Tax=Seminavis robusta TaxID=568900 RepID=A0A9N8EU87_9STRA|nr:expressed unknown protein [Seminavis robusta]|eukprot:Sro1640_g287920.1 n/a (1200) ;mRNA; r:8309-11908
MARGMREIQIIFVVLIGVSFVSLITIDLSIENQSIRSDVLINQERYGQVRLLPFPPARFNTTTEVAGTQLPVLSVQPRRRMEEGTEYHSLVGVKLNFEVFEGHLRQPTQQEWQDLLCQTNSYFTRLFRRKLGDLVYVNLHPLQWDYSPGIDMPLSISMVIEAAFEDGALLRSEDVYRCIRAVDSTDFLEGFIWKVRPQGLSAFYEAARVLAQIQVQSHTVETIHEESTKQIGDVVLANTYSCGETGIYAMQFFYDFFEGRRKEPTQSQVDALKAATGLFISRELQERFENRVVVDMKLNGWSYDANAAEYPVVMDCLVTTYLHSTDSVIPHEYVRSRLTGRSKEFQKTMIRDYIENVVWNTPPLKQSAFYEVHRVRIRNKIRRFTYMDPELAALHSAQGLLPEHSSSDHQSVTVPAYYLDPITVSDAVCEQFLTQANSNGDQYLTIPEYIDFVNLMTDQTFAGYPLAALPDVMTAVFDSMATIGAGENREIDLLGSFQADSPEQAAAIEATREDKLCQFFRTVVNDAVSEGGLSSAMVNATIEIYLDKATTEDESNRQGEPLLDMAFRKVVDDSVGPSIKEVVNKEKHATRNGRGLQDDSIYIAADTAHIQNLQKTECRHGETQGHTCYTAEGSLQAFVKGDQAPELAKKVATAAEKSMEKAVEDGELNSAIHNLGTEWSVEPLKSVPAPNASSAPPTSSPVFVAFESTEPPKKSKSFTENLSEGDGTTVAAAATGSIFILFLINFGRELLVDFILRIFKVCCKRYRRYRGYDDDSDSSDDDDVGWSRNTHDSHKHSDHNRDSQGTATRRTSFEDDDLEAEQSRTGYESEGKSKTDDDVEDLRVVQNFQEQEEENTENESKGEQDGAVESRSESDSDDGDMHRVNEQEANSSMHGDDEGGDEDDHDENRTNDNHGTEDAKEEVASSQTLGGMEEEPGVTGTDHDESESESALEPSRTQDMEEEEAEAEETEDVAGSESNKANQEDELETSANKSGIKEEGEDDESKQGPDDQEKERVDVHGRRHVEGVIPIDPTEKDSSENYTGAPEDHDTQDRQSVDQEPEIVVDGTADSDVTESRRNSTEDESSVTTDDDVKEIDNAEADRGPKTDGQDDKASTELDDQANVEAKKQDDGPDEAADDQTTPLKDTGSRSQLIEESPMTDFSKRSSIDNSIRELEELEQQFVDDLGKVYTEFHRQTTR